MLETFGYEQLDPETKAYLHQVRELKGRGAPGVYYPLGTTRPLWALIAGVIVGPLLFWIASTSTKAPWAVAMLQTAAVLLGGWLVLYAFRRWFASPERFAGWFHYFDPAHAFLGEGETIKVAPLPSDTEVAPHGERFVGFASGHDGFQVNMPSRAAAAEVADYYSAVDWVMGRQEGPWVGLPLAEIGGVARYLLEEDREPPSVQDTGLRIDDVPESVRAVRRPASGLIGYLAVIGVGLALFALFSAANPSLMDNRNFADAMAKCDKPEDGLTGAAALRDYLLNDRNTRHRDEAKAKLDELYDRAIRKTESAGGDKELGRGLGELLNELRGPGLPVVTLEVVDSSQFAPGSIMSDGLRMMVSDGLSKTLGKDIITFAKKPEGGTAMIVLAYRHMPEINSVSWSLAIRKAATDAEPTAQGQGSVAVAPGGLSMPGGETSPDTAPAISNSVTDSVYRDVMQKLLGTVPPKALPPQDDF